MLDPHPDEAIVSKLEGIGLTGVSIQRVTGPTAAYSFTATATLDKTKQSLTTDISNAFVGDDGFALLAKFGQDAMPDEPTTTIRVEREAYESLKGGDLAAQDAFLSGQIALEGDMQLAMQLALAVLSPE